MTQQDISTEEINLFDFWDFLMRYKKDILIVTALVTLMGLVYSLTTTPMYRAQVLMISAEADGSSGGLSSIANQLGNLSGGLSLPLGKSDKLSSTYKEILRSRSFIESFVEKYEVKPKLFSSQWDETTNSWKEQEPSSYKAYIKIMDGVFSLSENVKTSVVTLSIIWHEPEQAADWANILVDLLNQQMREKAIHEAERNISFLETQANRTSVLGVKNVLNSLVEDQLKKAMIANAREQYAFKIIDPALTPGDKFSPNRTLITILSFSAGLFLGILVAIILLWVSQYLVLPSWEER